MKSCLGSYLEFWATRIGYKTNVKEEFLRTRYIGN
jgi:hypothetical protein